ncbi:MAG TPA: ATP-binding cassette domain-containing protein [Oscillospiraceae bacterium]|nr:ATP-binding cassette domain-containing protein [Oscillospiraceae bacterium]HPS35053.1 ATP-binding cassette domain-containing protein [Oscillospiraceae bacterium]
MIEVNGLTKRYGEKFAIKDVGFKIGEGEIVGLLGPNGAGKSTTMNIMTGYLSATSGTVTVNGFDIREKPIEAKMNIGYLPELPPLYPDMTVKAYLDFIFDLKQVKANREEHISKICKLVKIEAVYPRLIKNLSKGFRQRVGIAQALIGTPPILILDEPTVGLDPKQIVDIRDLIANLGRRHTILVSSHILHEIQAVCNRIIIINQGEIVADGKRDDIIRKATEDARFTVRVIGPRDEVAKTLVRIGGVDKIVDDGVRESGSNDFIVIPKAKTDVRREVFERLAERKWPIVSMVGSQLTLEDVFLRLTETDETE